MFINSMNYLCSQKHQCYQGSGVYLIGIAFDGTACFRKGTRDGPSAIREISYGIESYSPYLHKSLEDIDLYDLGDVIPRKVINPGEDRDVMEFAEKEYQRKLDKQILEESRVVTLGGEHSVSLIPLKQYLHHYRDLVVIHLDAHADLRDGYEGFYYSHASVIYRALEYFGSNHRLIQYGIRSGTREEYLLMKKKKTLCSSRDEFLDRVSQIEQNRPIYLTFDLDYFDPSILPGTGTPEAGGEDFHSFLKLIKVLNKKNFVGADVVELSPALDPSGASSIVATTVVREIILALSRNQSS